MAGTFRVVPVLIARRWVGPPETGRPRVADEGALIRLAPRGSPSGVICAGSGTCITGRKPCRKRDVHHRQEALPETRLSLGRSTESLVRGSTVRTSPRATALATSAPGVGEWCRENGTSGVSVY
jgi:hypothetical protein